LREIEGFPLFPRFDGGSVEKRLVQKRGDPGVGIFNLYVLMGEERSFPESSTRGATFL